MGIDCTKPYFGVPASTSPHPGWQKAAYHLAVHRPSVAARIGPSPTGRVGNALTPRRAASMVGLVVAALAGATLLVALVEAAGVSDASPLYLLAVVLVASTLGTWPAVATAILAFVVYDVLFTEPRLSLVVADPREWVDLLLFLVVGVVIGRLVAAQRERAEEAAVRAAEASSLFGLARTLAVAGSTEEAAREVARRLCVDADLLRVVVRVGVAGADRTIADEPGGEPLPTPAIANHLVRTPGDEPARWVRTHVPGGATAVGDAYHVRIELDDEELGTLVALRSRRAPPPDHAQTRIIALAADQLATSLRRDQLRRAATELEVAREADRLKTALVDAVSHDLRTPLASIRATAGGLADPEVAWTDDERRRAGAIIDAEATRLDRLVSGLLDLGRIASGDVHPSLEAYEPWALVEPVVDRLRPALDGRTLEVRVPPDLPPVLVDAAFVDVVLTNLLDNAIRHAPAPAPIAIDGRVDDGRVRLTVADGGPGVADPALERLFDRFWRASSGSRPGMGIGLSVVKGLVEAMGGSVRASRAAAGGLAVEVALVRAPEAGRAP